MTSTSTNVATMILSPHDMLNGLRASQLINLDLTLFGTDSQREMEEGWDFTWLGASMAVSESSVHSLIQKCPDILESWPTYIRNQAPHTNRPIVL